mgnify:CR=1 FL=1
MKTTSILLIALSLIVSEAKAISGEPEVKSSLNSVTKKVAGQFGRVNAHRQQQGVGLSWTMMSTNGVAGFIIERSYDGIYFEEIDQVNVEISGRQRYNDNAVYPGFVHYRIVAMMEDGSSEASETAVVRIVSRK